MQKIIIISGPTASGKSAVAVELAQRLLAKDKQSVIINADSMQVYEEIPKITAQPTEEEREGIPHALYGLISASEKCSAGKWVELAVKEIEKCINSKQTPILVGGTGMYIRSLMGGMAEIPEIHPLIKEEVQKLYDEHGVEELYKRLLELDPHVDGKIDKENPIRVMRAWEVVTQTGKSFVQWQEEEQKPHFDQEMYDCYFLNPPREEIYEKVNKRFEKMVENGILDEVKVLKERGLDPLLPAMKAIGVPEIIKYLDGEITIEEAIEKAQQGTRNYVKRQLTWFNNQMKEFKEVSSVEDLNIDEYTQ